MQGEITFTCRHGLALFSTSPNTEVRLAINEENWRDVLGLIKEAIRLDVEKAEAITARRKDDEPQKKGK